MILDFEWAGCKIASIYHGNFLNAKITKCLNEIHCRQLSLHGARCNKDLMLQMKRRQNGIRIPDINVESKTSLTYRRIAVRLIQIEGSLFYLRLDFDGKIVPYNGCIHQLFEHGNYQGCKEYLGDSRTTPAHPTVRVRVHT